MGFLETLNILFNQIQQSLSLSDPLDLEHCKSKLERSIPIVAAISLTVNNSLIVEDTQSRRASLGSLLEELISGMETQLEKLTIVLEAPSIQRKREVTSLLPSTGGRPAFNLTKAQIEQLRDTGMNWRALLLFLVCLSMASHTSYSGRQTKFFNPTSEKPDNSFSSVIRVTRQINYCSAESIYTTMYDKLPSY